MELSEIGSSEGAVCIFVSPLGGVVDLWISSTVRRPGASGSGAGARCREPASPDPALTGSGSEAGRCGELAPQVACPCAGSLGRKALQKCTETKTTSTYLRSHPVFHLPSCPPRYVSAAASGCTANSCRAAGVPLQRLGTERLHRGLPRDKQSCPPIHEP